MPPSSINDHIKMGFLWSIAIALVIVAIMVDPIAQPLAYHDFADKHQAFGVPNFCNVVSNVPFALVTLLAMFWYNKLTLHRAVKPAYFIFFTGVFITCFGSAYYHWSPNNDTLMWDRLPMTIAFMPFFSIIITEYVSEGFGKISLVPFLLVGIYSVLYWHSSELDGAGDLRLYALVQFLPLVLIPLIFLMYKSPFTHSNHMWWVLIAYGLAKILEHFDKEVYEMFGHVGGHPLKHVAAALGPLAFLLILRYRRLRSDDEFKSGMELHIREIVKGDSPEVEND